MKTAIRKRALVRSCAGVNSPLQRGRDMSGAALALSVGCGRNLRTKPPSGQTLAAIACAPSRVRLRPFAPREWPYLLAWMELFDTVPIELHPLGG